MESRSGHGESWQWTMRVDRELQELEGHQRFCVERQSPEEQKQVRQVTRIS